MSQVLRPVRDGGEPAARGFILVLTLWIIALFGLGVAAINTWVSLAVENARVLRQRTADEVALSDAKNEIIYAIGSRPLTRRGLEIGTGLEEIKPRDMMNMMGANFETSAFIAFDRRPYVMASNPNYVVQIQDGRGLVNLNRVTPQLLRRLFALYDAPEALRNQLPDTLQDWIDQDDLTRITGAEKQDYERRRRPTPSNAALLTPLEAQNILGWDEIPQMWEDDLASPIFSTCASTGFNPNTAPKAVLLTYIPGLVEETAEHVIEQRQQSAFRQARDFMETANVTVPNEAFFFGTSPGNCMILDFVNRASGERTRVSLSIIPRSQNQPWQVDYAFKIPSQYRGALDGANPQITFPAPETIAAEQLGGPRAPGI